MGTGARLTKRQRESIKKTRKMAKTTGFKEAEKYLTAIRNHREMYEEVHDYR